MSQEARQIEQAAEQPSGVSPSGIDRPLYVKKVPEAVWNRVHENAIKSRMRLSEYLIKVLEKCQPLPPQPLVKRNKSTQHPSPERGG
jgi:hypothetical protein